MNVRGHLVAALAVVCGASAAAGQAPGNVPVAIGTASISGSVFVAGPSPQPARRVRVTLTDLSRASAGQTTTTDDRGAFMFQGVPAGRFEIQAFKPAYLRASYGAARPERAGTPVAVKNGEAIANLTIAIARGGVITGTVRDIRGRPVPGVDVRVLKFGYNALTGERTLGAPSSGSITTTDDRGEYRAFGLPPGGYLVLVAAPPSGRSGGPGGDDIRPMTAGEVQRALQTARGRVAPASAPPTPAPPPSPRVTYASLFHPGVTDIGAATTLALGVSEERTGADITLRLVPTATVRGTVSDPSGELPPMLGVHLVPAGPYTEMLAGAGLRGLSTTPRPDGSFAIAGVAAGSYTLVASIGRGRGALPNQPTKWASADVNVNGQDLDVPLTLQPGIRVNGRVVFEGAAPTAAELRTLQFLLMPPGSGGAVVSSGGGRVDDESRFTFEGLTPDSYRFAFSWTSPGMSDRWTVKSSITNGREAFEAPLHVIAGEPLDWTVTFTDTPTTLSGVFQDPAGRAAPDYYMVLFPADRALWQPGSRRIRTTRPATDGVFTFRGVLPGEYFLAALTDLEPGEWNDPTLLGQLIPTSVTLTLGDGQTTVQNFKIGQ